MIIIIATKKEIMIIIEQYQIVVQNVCNGDRIHNQLVHKQTLNHLAISDFPSLTSKPNKPFFNTNDFPPLPSKPNINTIKQDY